MKTAAGVAAVVGGILLIAIPRFIFPTCEAIGRGRMHCTDAARGEYLAGGLLAAAGAALLALKPGKGALAATALGALVCAAAFFIPAHTGYCMNPDMPCRYGMVPSVRFVAILVGLVQIAALIGLVRAMARREP